MFLSRWTFFQALTLLGLTALLIIADLLKYQFSNPAISANQQLALTLSFLFIVIGFISLLLYFQTKKSVLFLTHPLWDKMNVIVIIILVLSMIVFVIAANPVMALVERFRFMLYIFIYYFVYLVNLLVLSFVHKYAKPTTTKAQKVATAFWSTCFLVVFIQFVLGAMI